MHRDFNFRHRLFLLADLNVIPNGMAECGASPSTPRSLVQAPCGVKAFEFSISTGQNCLSSCAATLRLRQPLVEAASESDAFDQRFETWIRSQTAKPWMHFQIEQSQFALIVREFEFIQRAILLVQSGVDQRQAVGRNVML